MKKKLCILILEDIPADVVLFTEALRKKGLRFESRHVETRERFMRELDQHPPDVILSDHGLPEFDGFAALEIARGKSPEVPFIFVASSTDDRRIQKALQAGAAGCVSKERLSDLPGMVKRALRQAQLSKKPPAPSKTKPTATPERPENLQTPAETSERASSQEVRRLKRELQDQQARFEAELNAARQDLEAFSYAVSHDFRAPIRHIDGFVEILQRSSGKELDAESRRCLEVIATSARHLGNLIDSLLVYSRINRAEMRKANVNLRTLVEEAREALQAETNGRKILWRIGPLPDVLVDPPLIRQALTQLLSNALKFTTKQRTARIDIGAVAGETEHQIFIRDDGLGFESRYADRLFGVFQKLQSDYPGTGVGLASVRRIITRHGGKVWAKGQPGNGATFWFSLPNNPEVR